MRGRRRTREMGEWLLQLEPGGEGAFDDAMKSVAHSRLGRGVMVVLSDFLLKDGYERGLRSIAGRGFDVFGVQMLSPEELDPGANGLSGDLKLSPSTSRTPRRRRSRSVRRCSRTTVRT